LRHCSAACRASRCQCPHWGVVQNGGITFRWADHEETYGAGDAYYAPPGHLPLIKAGTSLVKFSLSGALQQTMAVLRSKLSSIIDSHRNGASTRGCDAPGYRCACP
jgi:hypothetical protein